jgi:hypothetical protein
MHALENAVALFRLSRPVVPLLMRLIGEPGVSFSFFSSTFRSGSFGERYGPLVSLQAELNAAGDRRWEK